MKGTQTTEGFIPHLEVYWGGGVLYAPVMIRTDFTRAAMALQGKKPVPKRCGTALCYALPGGAEMVKR